jgi:L-lactate dehydrogenase complex protein LldE
MSEVNPRHDAVPSPRVGLFVTCLADLFRPSVAFAAISLLERAGCQVEVPQQQVCCGQPAYSNGDFADARKVARQVIEAFSGFDYVVAPSGSCMGTLRHGYPELFADEPAWRERAQQLAARAHELTSFLVDVLGVSGVDARWEATATYHDSCAGLRELGVKQQPRRLLASVQGLTIEEMQGTNDCCGFGGTFCVKYPEISAKLVDDKVRNIEASGAGVVLGGDLGCLLNIAGRLRREGKPTRVYHVAEVLAGMTDAPGIGDGSRD